MKRRFSVIASILLVISTLLFGLIGCKEDDKKPTLTTYSFTVQYEDDTPAENVAVIVSLSGAQVASDNTDAQGKVSFSLEPKAYTVTVAAPQGYVANPITTDLAGTAQTITLFEDTLQEGQLSYHISVLSKGDTFGFKNVTVNFYQTDGTTLVRSAKTDLEGKARFNLNPAQYIVKLSDVPNGWTVIGDATKLADVNATPIKYNLSASVIKENMPDSTKYSIGSVVHDFTVTLSDGTTTFTLSEVLKEKKMVLLNFWYIGCSWCQKEFPGLNDAYLSYQDDVAVLALEIYNYTNADIEAIRPSYGFTNLPAAQDIGLKSAFNVQGAPTSIVIDRNGVVCFIEAGYMPQTAFETLFDQYIADDYLTTIVPDKDEDGSSDPEVEIIRPTTTFPGNEAVSELVSADGFKDTFTYSVTSNENDIEYSWPWTIREKDGVRVFGPSNVGVGLSYSILEVNFHAQAGEALAFDYWMQVETTYDYVYVQVDGVVMYEYSTNMTNSSFASEWPTCYAYVAPADGDYTLAITFLKDEADGSGIGADSIFIKNMRLVNESVYGSLSEKDTFHIKRYAVTNENDSATGNTPRFNDYVTYVYNETDGYMHVGTENGPLLLADLMNTTPWSSETSLYNFVLANNVSYEGQLVAPSLEQFAWRQNNSRIEILACTVDWELALALDNAMKAIAGNTYHENMWLEVCLYYDTYGSGEFVNPIRGLDFGSSAIKVEDARDYTVVSTANGGAYDGFYFTAEVPRMIVPRGFKYTFTPTVSGVYDIVSLGTADTIAWLATYDNSTRTHTFLAESDSCYFYSEIDFTDPLAKPGSEGSDRTDVYNFGIRQKLEAGTPYYLLCAFGMPEETGEYRVRVSFRGEAYKLFTPATSGIYTYDEQIGENGQKIQTNYILDTLQISLGEDGYYHPANKTLSGNETDYVYLDLRHTTLFLDNTTISLLFENRPELFDFTSYVPIGETDAVGVDYKAKMQQYLTQTETDENVPHYGCVKLDKDLYQIMLLFTERYALENDWPQTRDNVLALCLYYPL